LDHVFYVHFLLQEEYVDMGKYCATLGHKMNHSFRPNCMEWFFDHPRFGVIPCERTTRFDVLITIFVVF
jgi:hypothetical protein